MTHEEMFGGAKWLGGDGVSNTPCLRASFEAKAVKDAEITICGLGYFYLYINGRRVSEDLFVPATSDYVKRDITADGQPFDESMRHRCYCMRYQIAPLLHNGRNELAVALGPGFFAQEIYSYDGSVRYGEVRLCYRIVMKDADGKTSEALSGGDARFAQGIVKKSDFFCGEELDLNLMDEDWVTCDASDWSPARILPPMDTDYLVQDCPADRVIRSITPKVVSVFPTHTVYDAGENLTGWVCLKDEGKKGDLIEVEFSEALSACGSLDEHYKHWQFLKITSDGAGRSVHPLFTWNGLRYFSVRGKAKVEGVRVIHMDMPLASRFECADGALNWLYEAYVRTEYCNLHGGIPSDCPHLERRGYTGDGQLTCETMLLTFNPRAFMRKWIGDILDCQDENSGHVQYTAPYTRCGGGPGGWGSAIVSVPYQYYLQYGETDLLSLAYPGMLKYIDYLRAHSENGLVTSDRAGEWCLGDWCAPGGSRLAPPYVNTYFLIKSCETILLIEDVLRLPHDGSLAQYVREAQNAITRTYYDEETGDFAGGQEGASAFAVDIGLGDQRTLKRLAERYERLGGYDTGIFGTELVTRLLFEKGYAPLAYRLLTSANPASFEGMRRAGATTLWELWPGDPQRSLNHPMFGAPVKELFKYVLGIRREAAGWTRALIAPALTREIPSARGGIETPLGMLSVSYQVTDGGLRIETNIPEGMRAELLYRNQRRALPCGQSETAI